jgi:hypothetical protein
VPSLQVGVRVDARPWPPCQDDHECCQTLAVPGPATPLVTVTVTVRSVTPGPGSDPGQANISTVTALVTQTERHAGGPDSEWHFRDSAWRTPSPSQRPNQARNGELERDPPGGSQ